MTSMDVYEEPVLSATHVKVFEELNNDLSVVTQNNKLITKYSSLDSSQIMQQPQLCSCV